MAETTLIKDVKIFMEKRPELQRILKQFELDEEAYLEALEEITEEEPLNTRPIANTTYFGDKD
ncbi:MAG: hypothetical protein KAU58_04255 [Candidatus Omnitrophica bacterium]|nr:hypothetical protein [Candidatus Omnitrophota bacterium]